MFTVGGGASTQSTESMAGSIGTINTTSFGIGASVSPALTSPTVVLLLEKMALNTDQDLVII